MFKSRLAFSLLEVIIVVAIVVAMASYFYVATKPAKRLGEAADLQRKYDVESIEKAIKLVATDSGNLTSALSGLSDNTPYMLVKAGGNTAGTYACTATGTSIVKADISTAITSIMPALPVDPDLAESNNDTGYYLVKNGNSYNVETCDSYELAATIGNKQQCGDGYCGNTESCSTCAIDCGACAAPVCGNGIAEAGEQCDDGNISNTDSCLNTCLSPTCGDTYVWAGHETCDDGNVRDEYCGNAYKETAGTYCDSTCSATIVIAVSETCDYSTSFKCLGSENPIAPYDNAIGCSTKNPWCSVGCGSCVSACAM